MGLGSAGLHSCLVPHFAHCQELVIMVAGPLVEIWELLTDFVVVSSKRTIEFAKFSDFIFVAYP